MRKTNYYLLLLLILSGVVCFFSLSNVQDWGDDFALYIRQAQSLIRGDIQTCLNDNIFCQQNSTTPPGPELYPWGFPLLLAPVISLFGFNLLAMKVLEIVFF